MLLAAKSRGTRRRHRRRPARPRGRGRPQGAGHGRHRPAPDADADGAPARHRRRPSAAEGDRGARHPASSPRPTPRRSSARRRSRRSLLEDGTRLPADLVVMAVGIRPNAQLAKDAGLDGQSRHRRRRGDAHQRSRHLRGRRMRRGRTARCSASSRRSTRWRASSPRSSPATRRPRFTPSAVATKLKVTGINLFSAGDFADGKDREEIVLRDAARGVYKRLVLEGRQAHRRRACTATRRDGAWFFDLLKKGADIARDARDADLRPELRRRRPAGPYGGRCSLAG